MKRKVLAAAAARRRPALSSAALAPLVFLTACLNPDISDELPISGSFIAVEIADAGLEAFDDEPRPDEGLPADDRPADDRPADDRPADDAEPRRNPRGGGVRIRWRQ